jgi:uncharacterized membrane protein
MNLSRTLWGVLVGIVIAVIWQVLGGEALLWVLVLGVVGGLIGYVLDEPARLKAFAEKLER